MNTTCSFYSFECARFLEASILRLDGQLDFFWLDFLDQDRWQTRGQLNVALDLGGPFALTFGTVFYAQDDAARAMGLALTATAGLRVGAVTRAIPR